MLLIYFFVFLPITNAELNFNQNSVNYQFVDDNVVSNVPLRNKVNVLNVYSYIAAILLLDQILSTGTLINERWLISGAESVFINRNNIADVTARFGSQDYGRSGVLITISNVEIHPYFRLGSPDYDLSMLRLNHAIMLSPNIKPLKLPPRGEELAKSHFLVPSWSKQHRVFNRWNRIDTEPKTDTKYGRYLKFTHLHSGDGDDCSRLLRNVSRSQGIMCLYSAENKDTCQKDSGGPIVSRGELWGITSSFVPEECEMGESPTFVVMITAPDIQVWLNTVLKSQAWRRKIQINYFTSNDEDVALLDQGY